MEIKWGQVLSAAAIGFLVGLAYCYWKAIKAVYEKKDVISSGANFIDAGQDFYANLRKL